MALFAEVFETWTAADFDAYAEAKRKSNRFNLERTRVKARLVSLVEQALERSGMPATGVELWTSRHEPALVNAHNVSRQLVLLTRPVAAREAIEARDPAVSASEPDRFDVHLGIELRQDGVAFRVALPEGARLDRVALRGDLAAWQALAQDHAVRVGGEPAGVDDLPQASEGARDLALEQFFARQEAEQGAAGIDDLALWLTRTLPLLQALLQVDGATVPVPRPEPAVVQSEPSEPAPQPDAPVPESPAQSPVATREPSAEPLARRAGTYRPAQAPNRRAQQAEADRPPVERIVPPTWKPDQTEVGRQLHQTEARQRPLPPRPPRPEAPRHDHRGPPPRGDMPRGDMPRAGRPFELGPEPKKAVLPTTLEPGVRVRLTSGLFAGKFGTVTEVRGDDVQVMLGLMAVKVPKAQVTLV